MLRETSAKLHHLDGVLNEMHVNNQAISEKPTDQDGKKKEKIVIILFSCVHPNCIP